MTEESLNVRSGPKGLVGRMLDRHTEAIDALPEVHLGLWIALAAGLGMYLELMIIRLHSSYFQLFAYFKNVSLLSCFLGLGLGYARGSKRPLATPLVFPMLALQIVIMYVLRLVVPAGHLQNPIAEQLGQGITQAKNLGQVLVVYAFLILVFVFNALCFIPIGHLASRLMARKPKLVSYSWNLVGSLIGILAFSFISFTWAPPYVWILVAAGGIILFLRTDFAGFLASLLALAAVLVLLAVPFRLDRFDVYSPYQILTLNLSKDAPPVVQTSNTFFQRILDLRDSAIGSSYRLQMWSDYYGLPYYFKPAPAQVLVVGSGTGNDVAAAVRHQAGRIDAVEIDPAILKFGKELHPEAPYQAANVNAIVDDARAFIRRTDKRYDVIVYGLLDSHTLLSGRAGGIRLDSYVFTVEAFREARAKLSDDGLICLTFSTLGPQIGRKIFLMLKDAFDGTDPLVYQLREGRVYTFLAGPGAVSAAARGVPEVIGARIFEVTDQLRSEGVRADESTDDWPFLYMPVRTYPVSYLIMIGALLAVSVGLILRLAPASSSGFSAPCFFLGAGFMLVETKAITELALVYGSTWVVVSIVVTAILFMAFLANLLVIRIGNVRPSVTYGLLLASLVLGLGLTFANLGGIPLLVSRLMLTVVLTLPLFFSGFAFSSELGKSASVAVALSSNLLGAMLGGFLEYNSMYLGFRSLYLFALVAYGLALLGALRARPAVQ